MDVQPPDSGTPSEIPATMPPPPPPGASQPGYGLGGSPIGPGIAGGRLPQRTGPQPRNLSALLVLVGGLAVVVGVFLPWVQGSSGSITASRNGIYYGSYGPLILGALAAARGLSMLRSIGSRMRMGSPVVGGVLIAVLLATRWSTITKTVSNLNTQPGTQGSIGIGFWLALVGVACIVIGGLMSSRPGRL